MKGLSDQDHVALRRSARLGSMGLKVDGVPLSFEHGKGFPWIIGVLNDEHPHQVYIKGAQLGLTVAHIVKSFDKLRHQEGMRGVLYTFPTESDVADFSQARFKRMVEDNPAMRASVRETDRVNVKAIGHGHMYFRGSGEKGGGHAKKSKIRIKSIPVDELMLDERDEMDDGRVDTLMHRLDGAPPERRRLVEFSTPTVPEYGVDLAFKASDQQMWLRRCRRCNEMVSLEENWPEILAIYDDEHADYLCPKCREPFVSEVGKWVARCPDVTAVRGRWISQLHSPHRPPSMIAREWRIAQEQGGSKYTEFMNNVLGMAYAEIDVRLTKELIKAACGQDLPATHAAGPCAMGVDVGPRRLHWQVRERTRDQFHKILAVGEVDTFEALHDTASRFNVKVGVIDAQPETRKAREFVDAHPGWFLCYYSHHQKGEPVFDTMKQQVTVNRTETLDASHHEIIDKKVQFARPTPYFEDEFIPQMLNLARKTERDPDTGERKSTWVVLGSKNDHHRHTHNYARLATTQIPVAARVREARQKMKPKNWGRRRSYMAM